MRFAAFALALLFAPVTLGDAGDGATSTLLHAYYAGNGLWRDCNIPGCHAENQDWGVDSATYTLYLRWKTAHDPLTLPVFLALPATATQYPRACTRLPCSSWSDVPEWDAIALMRDYEALGGNSVALAKAKDAFAFVEESREYALGACPEIHYQKPGGGKDYLLKTLETDANYIKAALLLFEATKDRTYLLSAIRQYAAVRTYFLDPGVPLYSVYVFDDGKTCTQVPHRFFASVNGDMIWNGMHLSRATGEVAYRDQAIATARSVDRYLSDSRGIFADLQAENDVAEPLVEAMYDLAAQEHEDFARSWILRNAQATLSSRAPDGAFGRFFDGPAPKTQTISIWASNGGLSLEIAAAALNPQRNVSIDDAWQRATFVKYPTGALPSTITFTGSGVALIGALGAVCCEGGHARVIVDGVETFDRTGIWQNKTMSGKVPDSVLFAWRWPASGTHTVRIEGGVPNAKEGAPFLRLDGYSVLP